MKKKKKAITESDRDRTHVIQLGKEREIPSMRLTHNMIITHRKKLTMNYSNNIPFHLAFPSAHANLIQNGY
jgi:hypothetical protein